MVNVLLHFSIFQLLVVQTLQDTNYENQQHKTFTLRFNVTDKNVSQNINAYAKATLKYGTVVMDIPKYELALKANQKTLTINLWESTIVAEKIEWRITIILERLEVSQGGISDKVEDTKTCLMNFDLNKIKTTTSGSTVCKNGERNFKIALNYESTCQQDWYPQRKCNVKCVAKDHIRCDEKGQKKCEENWYPKPYTYYSSTTQNYNNICYSRCVANDRYNCNRQTGSRECKQNWFPAGTCNVSCIKENDNQICDQNTGRKFCKTHWYPPKVCKVWCSPDFYQYTCNQKTGKKICKQNWYPPNKCERKCVPVHEKYACHHKTGKKLCKDNWYPSEKCNVKCVSLNIHQKCNKSGIKYCQTNWYPHPNCTVECVPDDTKLRYECDRQTGAKNCKKNWYPFNSCNVKCVPHADTHECNQTTGEKICKPHWYPAKKCSIKCKETNSFVDGFTECLPNGTKICRSGYIAKKNCKLPDLSDLCQHHTNYHMIRFLQFGQQCYDKSRCGVKFRIEVKWETSHRVYSKLTNKISTGFDGIHRFGKYLEASIPNPFKVSGTLTGNKKRINGIVIRIYLQKKNRNIRFRGLRFPTRGNTMSVINISTSGAKPYRLWLQLITLCCPTYYNRFCQCQQETTGNQYCSKNGRRFCAHGDKTCFARRSLLQRRVKRKQNRLLKEMKLEVTKVLSKYLKKPKIQDDVPITSKPPFIIMITIVVIFVFGGIFMYVINDCRRRAKIIEPDATRTVSERSEESSAAAAIDDYRTNKRNMIMARATNRENFKFNIARN